MNAETAPRTSVDPQAVLLQWGRVLMNAETVRVLRTVGTHRHFASMGPRSHERGNESADRSLAAAATGFNGAAFS